MQIFLSKNSVCRDVNEYINVKFDNNVVCTFFKGEIMSTLNACIGDVINVAPQGGKKPPIVNKVTLPTSRGKKLLWAFSFVAESTQASSYEEFYSNFCNKIALYGTDAYHIILDENQKYAFVLVSKRHKGTTSKKSTSSCESGYNYKPLYAFIADDIDAETLHDMIVKYSKIRKIYTPLEFFKVI